jgi:putative protease
MAYIELLAPAGGPEALRAAVQNGADAVYLGEKSFSARSGAQNFDREELKEAVKYSRVRGTQVYLALNTLVHDRELESFASAVKTANECGVSGLIIQDLGGAKIAKEVCPKLNIHASTQMSAHNEKDVEALLEYGFSRVVLARELSKEEIYKIYKNTGASLEVFVHGALCVSVSGQCLMSSFIGGRSGNRGSCAQPCRQCYSAEGKKGFFLSPRDLCLLDEIDSLSEIGVDSLKIEGRMKSPEYVAAVTAMYRKYLDNPKRADRKDIAELEGVFVRGDGFTKGYYKNINTPEIMNYSISNDKISAKADKDAMKRAASSYRDGVENKKLPVSAFLEVKSEKNARLTVFDGENSVTAEGAKPEKAINTPMSVESAKERISKLGQTPYFIDCFEADIDENITMSAKDLNALRREAMDLLSEKRGENPKRETFDFSYKYDKGEHKLSYVAAQIMSEAQLKGADEADEIYLPLNLFEKIGGGDKFAVALPKVTYNFEKYIERMKRCGAKKALCSTIGQVKAVIEAGIEPVGDFGLNVYNALSASEYESTGIRKITLSPELTAEQIREIGKKTNLKCEAIAYGRMMMMTTRACIIRGIRGKCNCENPVKLKDKTGAEFLVYADKNEHINMIYNSNVTFMADKADVLKNMNVDGIRLVFTDESEAETRKIIEMYKGKTEAVKPKSFTRGYFINAKKK